MSAGTSLTPIYQRTASRPGFTVRLRLILPFQFRRHRAAPRNRFLRLLHGLAQLTRDSSLQLLEAVSNWRPAAAGERLEDLAQQALFLDWQVTRELTGSFLTPLDCEDIRGISSHLMKIIRAQEKAVSCFPPERPSAGFTAVSRNFLGCSESLSLVLATLAERKPLDIPSRQFRASHRATVSSLRELRGEVIAAENPPAAVLHNLAGVGAFETILGHCKAAHTRMLAVSVKNS